MWKEKIIYTALYRSPSHGINKFFIRVIDILEKLTQKNQYIILVGDLNINVQEGGSSQKYY
jgi:hypothetical protein